MTEPIRVVLVDDHPAFLEGLKALLSSTSHIGVVAAVPRASDGIRAAADLQPDVVIMDLHMPGVDGIEATQQIVATSPHIAVLVLTMLEDTDSIFSAMRAGARGYILKGSGKPEIVRAVEAVVGGEAIFGASVAEQVMGYFSQGAEEFGVSSNAFPQLTGRERELLGLIAAGQDNAEIARALSLSLKTVRNHVSNIFTKLQVAHRAQAIILAREAGMGRRTSL